VTPAPGLGARLAAAPPRTRALLVAGAAAAALLLAIADDPLLQTAGRASLAVLAIGAAALLVRRRGSMVPRDAVIEVVSQRHLSRDAAVALVRVGGRELLVGHGGGGVRLLADLGAALGSGVGDGARP
jgi:flagellar biogenesis protein FliO